MDPEKVGCPPGRRRIVESKDEDPENHPANCEMDKAMDQRRQLRKIYWLSGILLTCILVFLLSFLFLNPSSVGNPAFVRNVNLWAVGWALTFLLILVLSFILARTLIKLFFEYQANHPGSRFKSKLVMTLILFSLFPALIMSFLAFGLINETLREWFSSPSDQMVRASQKIARNYYGQRETFSKASVRMLADQFDWQEGTFSEAFRHLEQLSGFTSVLVVDATGKRLYESGSRAERLEDPAVIQSVLAGRDYYSLQRQIKVERGLVGVPARDGSGRLRGAIFARFVIPEATTFYAIEVNQAADVYAAIKREVDAIRVNYFSILALTTLAVVFGFVWLGTYIAKRITVPIEALAEGSRKLAEGDLDHRVGVRAVDELAILVDSFNRMADEIKLSRGQLERANAELQDTNIQLEERRHYIETILQNIATGVLTTDDSETIRTVNEAALKLLQTKRESIVGRRIQDVASGELYREFRKLKKRAQLYGTYRREVTFQRDKRAVHVAATVSYTPRLSGEEDEYLIVLDDLTELIRAEKFAAWQEVARRLAHEIKNPLTPIQLSAERINRRFEKLAEGSKMEPALREMSGLVNDATRIIVSEAQILKNMVEEFSRFARLPMSRPVLTDLNDLLIQTLSRYDGNLGNVKVDKRLDPRVTRLKVDPEQLQRVFVNLIDNSLDALAEVEGHRQLSILTRLNEKRRSVTIEFRDNGTGIEPEDYEHLFLPYFSTKKKGTGLGLAIVRQIVTEHNGHIRAEPNAPAGTKVIMELPLS